MRVISGSLKGRKIKGYDIDGTRPTMDRVKMSLFGSIQNYIQDAYVLDLFAGSGNLGIEAISNGAKRCFFVDNNHQCIKVIRENIKEFKIEDKSTSIEMDYCKALEIFKDKGYIFDIIFVDPPYKEHILLEILENVRNNHLLSKDGLIILEYNYEYANEVDGYTLLKKKKYGDKFISIYQKNKKKVDNLLLTRFDIERIMLILGEKDNIKRIYINFCNPWPKGKHRKKRLTHTRQLEKYKTFLAQDGEVYFKTDDDDLFNSSLIYFEEAGFEILNKTYNLHKEPIWENNIETEHEKMFSEQGIKIKALIAKKSKKVLSK